MDIVTKGAIDRFYANRRIAVIGASRDKRKYAHVLLAALRTRGYDVVAVNPNASAIDGILCFQSIKDVTPKVEAAIAVLAAPKLDAVVRDCAQAGVRTLWMHEHVMKGVRNPRAIFLCEENGIECIAGFCPMMFLPKTGLQHRMHGSILRLFGAYPA